MGLKGAEDPVATPTRLLRSADRGVNVTISVEPHEDGMRSPEQTNFYCGLITLSEWTDG